MSLARDNLHRNLGKNHCSVSGQIAVLKDSLLTGCGLEDDQLLEFDQCHLAAS